MSLFKTSVSTNEEWLAALCDMFAILKLSSNGINAKTQSIINTNEIAADLEVCEDYDKLDLLIQKASEKIAAITSALLNINTKASSTSNC